MKHITTEIAIIGGGLGGVAAALTALSHGRKVTLTEEYPWLGGQVTSQGVPPDEHRYIEQFGTQTYRAWRERVRKYYQANYPLTDEARKNLRLNPGGGGVSALCHEPKVSAAIFEDLLAPYISLGQLVYLREVTAQDATLNGERVTSVTVFGKDAPEGCTIHADYFLDATECGDLLPITNTAYVTGSEAKADTGEDHALESADPEDMQAVTWCFAMSRDKAGSDHTIPKPEAYEYWKQHLSDFWPGSQLSWTYVKPITLAPTESSIDALPGVVNFWRYRKILESTHYEPEDASEEITLVNWPQNDYWMGNLFEVDAETAKKNREAAKEMSRCWFYWLQTEAPRGDGGVGYPELRLRGDSLGTEDGFAMAPYIRESRRIVPLYRITEGDVGYRMRLRKLEDGSIDSLAAEQYFDSVGIGFYRIDLHPSTSGRTYIDILSLPFQIPLGALIPQERTNLLAANKNIGTTHITNGCYRLHPVEWNIGEAAAHSACYCLAHGLTPAELRANAEHLSAFQKELSQAGIPLAWPKELEAGWIPYQDPEGKSQSHSNKE